MIVTDRPSGGFPNKLLRVEIRSSRKELKYLDLWVLLQESLDQLATTHRSHPHIYFRCPSRIYLNRSFLITSRNNNC